MIEVPGKYTTAYIMIDQIDENCMAQIIQMINHQAFKNPVIIMPDTHSGTGSVIGFTMLLPEDCVVPNVVGVDLNCGMLTYNIGDIDINLEAFDEMIRQKIPFGTNVNKNAKAKIDSSIKDLCKKIGVDFDYVVRSIGTVGSGNHFIELGKSKNTNDKWITIHSGSRHLGKEVCLYWQNKAWKRLLPNIKDIVQEIKEKYPKKEWEKEINHAKVVIGRTKKSDLDYITGEDKNGYISDMQSCQEYAQLNRKTIMDEILLILEKSIIKRTINIKERIETIHNYIDLQDNIIRKGAIRSYIGERMIIPFNMRDGILICEGKSNPEWNFSAPHGAGRVYSRSKAKAELSLEKFKNDMKGIFSTSVCMGTLDECPDAYKDSKIIEDAIKPTATILDRIIPIHNMKDINEKSWKK